MLHRIVGPLLLGKVLDLNETQTSILSLIFASTFAGGSLRLRVSLLPISRCQRQVSWRYWSIFRWICHWSISGCAVSGWVSAGGSGVVSAWRVAAPASATPRAQAHANASVSLERI